ncbi:MAG: mannose-1-phosphate guanylyltransferase/mannose-6-phosphate isomerase [Sphingomonadales bacterium]|jgi:mannose-1-phosphate guanylyltransferase
MEKDLPNIVPVILSGGSGSRLWPTSRVLNPKQFHNLLGEGKSLLQQTLDRVRSPVFTDPLIISSDKHRFLIAEQLRQTGADDFSIILEPQAKNTAPAITLGALHAIDKYGECLLLVLPSDHLIPDIDAFLEKIQIATEAVKAHGQHATFGIHPTKAETGYGYIKVGKALGENSECNYVDKFVEKPDLEHAKRYLEDGGYLWNSGIFLFDSYKFIEELQEFEPQILAACKASMEKAKQDTDFLRPDPDCFTQSPSISVDYAIMERTSSALVIPCTFSWSDVGSWSAIWDVSQKNSDGNVITGDVFAHNIKDSLLRSEGPIIAALGLENVIVVATADAVLVADQDQVQDVKKIVDQLSNTNRAEHVSHTEVQEPWGTRLKMDASSDFEISRLTITPGQHVFQPAKASGYTLWTVITGNAHITRGKKTMSLSPGQSFKAEADVAHDIANCSDHPLCIIEVRKRLNEA